MMKDKILVVDADPFILSIIKTTLESAGYKVYTALDGESALEQFHYRRPDLLIVDIMLPHLSGWEVCRRIRKQSNMPILIHTPVDSPEYRLHASKLGVDQYLVKPVLPKVLKNQVELTLKPQPTPLPRPVRPLPLAELIAEYA
ncbi:MAG: response regulator [Anaerolineae bacterium]|nr:response regulator [Anaerolineae bacterium]